MIGEQSFSTVMVRDLHRGKSSSELSMAEASASPFSSIEDAYEYLGLLGEVVSENREAIREEIVEATLEGSTRRVDALKLVGYKLERLGGQLTASRRLLNDLRTLRRILLGERERAIPLTSCSSAPPTPLPISAQESAVDAGYL